MSRQTDYYSLRKQIEQISGLVRKHRVAVVTATQPSRGNSVGLSPEEMARLASQPLVIDYVGLLG